MTDPEDDKTAEFKSSIFAALELHKSVLCWAGLYFNLEEKIRGRSIPQCICFGICLLGKNGRLHENVPRLHPQL